MKKLIWTLQIILALVAAGAGGAKLLMSKADLQANPSMGWTNDFSATQIKLIGTAEVAGAIGLIVPAATGILPVLTPVAASGFVLLMAGAVVTHLRRDEPVYVQLALALMAVLIVYSRFRVSAGEASPPLRT